MDSLTTTPCATTLKRLFAAADATDQPLKEQLSQEQATGDTFTALLAEEANDPGRLYHRFADNFLSVSPDFGRFLYICARASGARRVVEFGTSFGVSTIHLAAAVRDNGGGQVVTTELEGTKAAAARDNLHAAGFADLVDVHTGDARDVLATESPTEVDLLLLDGAITLYRPVLDIVEPHLRSGALVVADNAIEEATGYLEHVRDPANGYVSVPLPFGAGNEISLRTR